MLKVTYLTCPHSCYVGFFYLSNKLSKPNAPLPNNPAPTHNGEISIANSIMRSVLVSAAKAELAKIFHNNKDACPMQIATKEMGHPQPPSATVTDNTTMVGITNNNIKQKQSKAINM
mmetsp:Transcript_36091/g.51063  ORF Transcript_36091/g.51063 Transcript_36091/m.51063 type:complete len:117 (-) Transcript_36091:24-374(-)